MIDTFRILHQTCNKKLLTKIELRKVAVTVSHWGKRDLRIMSSYIHHLPAQYSKCLHSKKCKKKEKPDIQTKQIWIDATCKRFRAFQIAIFRPQDVKISSRVSHVSHDCFWFVIETSTQSRSETLQYNLNRYAIQIMIGVVIDTVMSVWLPNKKCSWDRHLNYLVWTFSPRLNIRFRDMRWIFPFRYVFKRGSNPFAFPTFWICHDTGRVLPGELIFLSNCYFDPWSNNVINCGQNRVLDPISLRVSTMLPISLSILPSFTEFSMFVKLLPVVISWSTVLSFTATSCCLSLAALPIITSWSKSCKWLRSLLFHRRFLRVETKFTLPGDLNL